jgi:Sulfotransferase family
VPDPVNATRGQLVKPARRPRIKHVFIVSPARSGSTLLRYLLDAHPQIVGPAELNLSALLLHAADTWHRAHEMQVTSDPGAQEQDAGQSEAVPRASSGTPLSADSLRWATRVVNEVMSDLARAAGASVFVDKSLVTVDQLPVVVTCYPKASYVFLYRYPLDMIASGIEASRWGFNAFGFPPYIGAAPGNFVSGLGNYWIDKVSRMLAFESTATVAHARIYYELLCDDPVTTLSGLLEFLGLPFDNGMVERAFENDHAMGPGDYKIDFTRSVRTDSVGRGSALPRLLGPEQVTRIDELLAQLDYPSLESARRGNLAALLGLKQATRASAASTADLTRQIAERLSAGLAAAGRPEATQPAFELIVRGNSGEEQTVLVDPERGVRVVGATSSRAGTAGPPQVVCYGDALLKVASGERNLAEMMHDGLVKIELDGSTGRQFRARRDLLSGLNSLLCTGQPAALPSSPVPGDLGPGDPVE